MVDLLIQAACNARTTRNIAIATGHQLRQYWLMHAWHHCDGARALAFWERIDAETLQLARAHS
eukprot:6697665-Pyramimonas_sp.AAC.1